MAGSYRHIVDADNNFRGINLIDNLGDAHEALEECYDMIQWLAQGDKHRICEAWKFGHIEVRNPGRVSEEPHLFTDESFWERDE